jgi:hypothetical protein
VRNNVCRLQLLHAYANSVTSLFQRLKGGLSLSANLGGHLHHTRPCLMAVDAHGIMWLHVMLSCVSWPLYSTPIKQSFRCPTAQPQGGSHARVDYRHSYINLPLLCPLTVEARHVRRPAAIQVAADRLHPAYTNCRPEKDCVRT